MADPQSWDEVMGVEAKTPSWDDVMAQKPVEGGLLASAKQMVGSTIKGAGQVAADFVPGVSTDNPVSRYGQSVVDANPTAVHSLGDIADHPVTAVTEAVGNAGGSVAGMVGVRLAGQAITAASPLAGPAAPAVAIAGQLVSWLGPAAIAALPSYSGIRDKQLINNPEAQDDGLQKAKAAIGAAAVGAIETKFGPQNWALATLTKEGRAELAKKFAAKSLTGAVAKGATLGAAVEGSEELVQNPIEQLASGDDPLTEASVKDTLFGGAMGAIGGGVLGGGAGAIQRVTESPKVAPPKPILEASDVDSAIEAFKFQVSSEKPDLAQLRSSYKDHAPEETAAHQADLEAALHSDPSFAPDAEGKPTAYGAPLRALAPQELPSEGDGLTRDAYEAIAALNRASGLKTVVYQDHANLPDGLVKQPDVVFVSSKTSIDPVVVAAHEAQHLSEEGEAQTAYAKIVQEELTENADALARARHDRADHPGSSSPEYIAREIRADITGDAWADPTFHGRVIEKMRAQLGEKAAETNAVSFLDSIKNLITRIRDTLTGTTFTSPDGQRLATQYVKNLERVHDALAAAIADHFIQKGYRPPGASTNTSQVLVARAIEQQAARVAAEAVPAFQRTAEQKIRAGAAPLAAPIGSSPELVSALAAAAKAPFDRTTEERLNLEAIRIGVRMSPKNKDSTVYWHGSPGGDMRGAANGLHVGTREAAKQALEARIGIPAEGEWDGTREYGKTLLKRARGGTGYSADGPDVEHYPAGKAKYSDGSPVSLTSKPNILPFRVIGEMTNSPEAPHEDFKANALMRGQITRGTAKRGFYYKQVGEDEGSISAVVPSADHLQLLKKEDVQQSPKSERAKFEAARSGVVVNIGLNVGDKKSVSDKQALAALKLAGVKVLSSSVQQSDTEATLVATLDRALSPAEAHTVATNLKQEAIAQLDKGKGELYGPKAEAWRPFNPEFFLTPDGKRLAPRKAPAATDKRTGVALTKQMRDSSLDTILYGDRSPYGVTTQVELAEMLQDLATTHEPARVEDTPENREFVARVLEHEARLALAQDENAVGWYGETTDAAIRIAGLIYPEIATDADARFAFTYALAVTSNGATIKENVQNAFTIYKSYAKSGRMPDIGFGVRRANMQIAFRVWNERVKKTGLPAFREFMLSLHSVRDLKKINPSIAEVMEAQVYGGTVIGPKIGGAFLQNLNGNHDALAMDRWFMRTWGRVTGDMVGEKKGEKTTKDTPANANQRQYIRGTMSMALARLQKDHPSLTMSDLQAVLWYPEKLLYTMHGVNDVSGMPTDYAIEAVAYAKLKGVDSAKIQAARVQPDVPAGRVTAGEDGQPGLGREAAFSPKASERRRDAGAGEGARDTRDEPRGADQQGRTPEGWSREVGPQTPSYRFHPRGPGKSPTALVGIHYGDRAGLSELDPNKFGTGTRAEERDRISSFTPHLLRRVYFYAQKADGKLPQGEGIVTGGHAYRVLATNIYDAYEDPDGVIAQWVKEGRPNGMSGLESGILASGYDGYFNRSHTADGAFVIIGPTKGVPVEYLGTRAQAQEKLTPVQMSPKAKLPNQQPNLLADYFPEKNVSMPKLVKKLVGNADPAEMCAGGCVDFANALGEDSGGRVMVIEDENVTYHAWVEHKGRIYDPMTPGGVSSWKELPFFKENFKLQLSPKATNQKEYDSTHGQRSAGPELQADEELQRTVGGGRPAQGWARATRIRGGDGKPLALHRGAATPLSAGSFELDRLGYASENPSSGVGVWFTVSASEAATYGKSESFFLDIRNPRVFKVEDLPGFDSVEAAHAWRESLRAEGHDGLIVSAKHLGGRVHVVAFDATQVVRPAGDNVQMSPKWTAADVEDLRKRQLHEAVDKVFREASYYGKQYPVRAGELVDALRKVHVAPEAQRTLEKTLKAFGRGEKITPEEAAGGEKPAPRQPTWAIGAVTQTKSTPSGRMEIAYGVLDVDGEKLQLITGMDSTVTPSDAAAAIGELAGDRVGWLNSAAEEQRRTDFRVATGPSAETLDVELPKVFSDAGLKVEQVAFSLDTGPYLREAMAHSRMGAFAPAGLADGLAKKFSKGTADRLAGGWVVTVPKSDAQFSPKTPEFKKWFADSKVVDAKGEPLVVYHGSKRRFTSFSSEQIGTGTDPGYLGAGYYFGERWHAGIYAFMTPEAARNATEDAQWSGEPYIPVGHDNALYPVYLSLQNPLRLDEKRDPKHAWRTLDREKHIRQKLRLPLSANAVEVTQAARAAGHDGVIFTYERRDPESRWPLSHEYVAFDPTQIKSAIGNSGTFDPNEASIQFSPKIVGDSKRPYTPAQRSFFERTGRTIEKPTLLQKIANMRKDLGKKMAQGLVDQFAPLKALSPMAYMLARLSKGSAGALEALLHHGKLRLNAGAFDADRSGGFIEKVGIPLHGELEDFLWWVAANRAEHLTAQDRERLFSKSDSNAGKTLANGNLGFEYTLASGQKTRVRALAYADALKNFDAFNKNALDIAEQSGLIDPQSRKIWEHEFYVPFYRVSDEDGGFIGGQIGNALVRQRAFKHLKGGEQKLNSDLLANTISNWAHLIDASAKNRAAKASLEAAANMGVAVEADAATIASMGSSINKNGVWFVDGGVKRHFLVDDPFVLTAITSLEYSGMRGPLMDAMSTMKHVLTVGVTASPFFKVKNLIRDSLQAIAVAPIGANPVANIAQGIAASDHSTQSYVSALASGGLIRFGTMLEGRMSDRVRQLVKSGVKDTSILNSDSKLQAMYDKFIEPAVVAYNELGNRSEEITRAALYTQLTAKGMDHATASLMARDLMDFSLQGSWSGIRFLTQVVPFMNARMQGLYKLGRGAADDPKRFAAVIGATAMFSIALLAAYSDDDEWKKREDWDRDNFWWFKVAGHAFRIPKPFEIGAIATLAERGLEYFISPEMTGERFRKVTLALVANNLSMNPVPQLVKPIIDLYANTDSFSGRPIETMGMERLRPDYRFTSRTSMLARGLGTAGQAATSVVGVDFISPVKIDHALRGYFGWLGSFVVGTSDMVARPLTNQATRPAGDLWKLATGDMIAELPTDQSRYVSHMYEQARTIEQAYGTYRSLLKEGKGAEAREFLNDNRDKIVKYQGVERVKRAEAQLNERIRILERSALDPEAKKVAIAAISAQKDRVARLVN